MQPTQHDLRCECPARLLLAKYGRNVNGEAYVLVEAYKGREPRTKVYVTTAASLWCRACDRWWNIQIKNDKISSKQRPGPPALVARQTKTSVMLDNPLATQ